MEDLTLTVKLEFKTQRERDEFLQVQPRAQALALLSAFYMQKILNYQAVVTSVKRTPEEQAALKASGLPAVNNSPHEDWRAIDLRLNTLPNRNHVPVLLQVLNDNFKRIDGFPTAIAHGSGAGYHLHLQVPKKFSF